MTHAPVAYSVSDPVLDPLTGIMVAHYNETLTVRVLWLEATLKIDARPLGAFVELYRQADGIAFEMRGQILDSDKKNDSHRIT